MVGHKYATGQVSSEEFDYRRRGLLFDHVKCTAPVIDAENV